MTLKESIIEKLSRLKDSQLKFEILEYKGELTFIVDKNDVVEVCNFLKTDPELQFNLCEDVTAIDWAKRKNRFTVVYHIFSMKNRFRLRLKADLDESDLPDGKAGLSIDSVSSVWKTADWHERETFD